MFEKEEMDYWKTFNRFAKFVGFVFVVGGVIGAVYGIDLVVSAKQINGLTGIDENMYKFLAVIVPLFILISGLLVIISKPFYPDRIKKYMNEQKYID